MRKQWPRHHQEHAYARETYLGSALIGIHTRFIFVGFTDVRIVEVWVEQVLVFELLVHGRGNESSTCNFVHFRISLQSILPRELLR